MYPSSLRIPWGWSLIGLARLKLYFFPFVVIAHTHASELSMLAHDCALPQLKMDRKATPKRAVRAPIDLNLLHSAPRKLATLKFKLFKQKKHYTEQQQGVQTLLLSLPIPWATISKSPNPQNPNN